MEHENFTQNFLQKPSDFEGTWLPGNNSFHTNTSSTFFSHSSWKNNRKYDGQGFLIL